MCLVMTKIYALIVILSHCLLLSSCLRCVNRRCVGLKNVQVAAFQAGLKPRLSLQMKTKADDTANFPDFKYLVDLKERVDSLCQQEKEFMMGFWNAKLNCFQIAPSAKQSVSVISTCRAIELILANKEHWKSDVTWADPKSKISLMRVTQSVVGSKWTFDAFQSPIILSMLAKSKALSKDDEKYKTVVKRVLEQRSQLSQHRQQANSAYLRYENVNALLDVITNDMVPSELGQVNDIGYALERANMVAYDEMSRQLAFHYAGDSSNFDAVVLGFTLLTYFKTSQSIYLSTYAKGIVPSTNWDLMEVALKVVFENQYTDGTWRKGEPIYTFSNLKGRDLGNSYVFFYDLMTGLLDLPTNMLTPYLSNLERCLHWAENNILKEIMPIECNEYGVCTGPMVQGWKSNHITEGGAAAWSTASVFAFLDKFRNALTLLCTNSVLKEFKGKTKESVLLETGTRDSWSRLMDADLEVSNGKTSIKDEIFQRVLLPQLKKEISMASDMLPAVDQVRATARGDMPNALYNSVVESGLTKAEQARYSLILFGPPGTAKTTIVQNMASVIKRNFLAIDTASFLADGLGNVASRMTYIFERLKTMEDTVILFDEIEEFCLDRENPNIGMESRLLTTAMLTQLNALRREQKNIFVVATNRLRSFDAAVIRPGRFDMLLFVGTPNMAARQARLEEKLSKWASNASRQEAATKAEEAAKVSGVMAKVWSDSWDELRFQTFAENEALLSEVLAMLEDSAFSEEAVRLKIEVLQRTATIQGQVKDEYIESELLSRL